MYHAIAIYESSISLNWILFFQRFIPFFAYVVATAAFAVAFWFPFVLYFRENVKNWIEMRVQCLR